MSTNLRNWKANGLSLLWSFLLPVSWSALGDATNAPAPSDDWVVRSWQTKDGLPQNTVYAILQTRDGYLWVGTGGGLARFDGARFRTFGLLDGLQSVQISALVEDGRGVLWVGTRGGGLSRWEKGHFTTFSKEEGLAASTVEALAVGRGGTVWIGTPRGLVKWHDGEFKGVGGAAGLPEKHVRALLEDSRGVLWVSILEGVYRSTNDQVFEQVEVTGPALAPVYSFCEDREGYVWAGGGNGHLWKIGERTWERFDQTNGVPFQLIESLVQGREGPVWIGTREGGLHYGSDGAFQKLPSRAGLSGSSVHALVVDRDGALWAGTGSGLNRLSRKLLQVWGTAEGLEHRAVTAITEDSSEGFWLTTQSGGVYRFQDRRFSRVKEPSVWSKYPTSYTILATADGSIWAAGESFLYRFHSGQETQAYVDPPIGGEAIRALCADDQGVWLGTYYSTLLKADAAGVRVVMTNGSLGGEIRSLVREGPENLWIGTAAGLYHWQSGKLNTWTTRDGLLSASIEALHRDPDGTIWIGTLGGGLARLKDGRMITVTTRQGLADDVISQIVADDFGHLWLGCNHGIMRVAKGEIDDFAEGKTLFVHAALLGQNEGMLKEQCSGGHSPTALKTRDGRLLFPTVEGIVEIDPHAWLEPPTVIPQASIEEVRVDGQVQSLSSQVVVAPGSRHLEVTYGAPSLRGADSVHFRFRVEPLEKEWVNAGLRRTAYYANLRPGGYVFRVTAGGIQGDWNANSAVLGIVVKPYYWQTLWFQLLMVLAVCGAGFAWYFHRMARLEKTRAAQEAFTHQLLLSQENERKRVASELHDGLGQDLLLIKNRVALLASDPRHAPEAAQQLADISKDASRAIADVRAISHALRPAALEQVGLTKALEWMVEQVAEASSTKFSTELENIDGLLGPDMEINLYRIVQEGLNNVIKHSQASQVILELKRDPMGVSVSIFDNGKGFDPELPESKGIGRSSFGLTGMKERAKVLGGLIILQSAPGTGTRLTLNVPLSQNGK